MRKLLFIVIAVIIQLNVNSQNTFNKVFYYFGDSTNTRNDIVNIIKLDSTIISSCILIDTVRGQHIGLTKADLNGNILDTLRIYDTSNYYPYPGQSMILTSDSSIIVCSSRHIFNPNSWDGYLLKLNKNLDTIWSKVYDIPDTLIGCANVQNPINPYTTIIESTDKKYIASGIYYLNCNFTTYDERSYLIKLDTSGNILWRNIYTDVSHIYNIINANDSGFYFIGLKNNSFKLFKTDKNGNIEWHDDYATIQTPIFPSRVERLDSNNLIIASCYWRDFQEDQRGLLMSRYNLNSKTIIWEKRYKLFYNVRNPEFHQNFEFKILPNNDIVFVSTVSVHNWDTLSGGVHAGILKVNSYGDSLWAHNYHTRNFDEFNQVNDFVLTEDGGFLLAGYHSPTNNSYNPGAWLVKTDSMGNAPNMHTVGIKKPAPSSASGTFVRFYPNPANDYLTLEYNTENLEYSELVLEIYDIQGRIVLSKQLSGKNNDIIIDLTKLESGIYNIKVRADNRILENNKLNILE